MIPEVLLLRSGSSRSLGSGGICRDAEVPGLCLNLNVKKMFGITFTWKADKNAINSLLYCISPCQSPVQQLFPLWSSVLRKIMVWTNALAASSYPLEPQLTWMGQPFFSALLPSSLLSSTILSWMPDRSSPSCEFPFGQLNFSEMKIEQCIFLIHEMMY